MERKIETQEELDSLFEIPAGESFKIAEGLKLKSVLYVYGELVVEGLARGSASVEAWGSASVEARGSARVVARDSASVEARDSAHVEAWDSASVRVESTLFVGTVSAFAYSVIMIKEGVNAEIKKVETALLQVVKPMGWFDREGVEKADKVVVYKRVSTGWKTQESTENETLWEVGSIVTHHDWRPESDECGEGKFHACSRPYFCDEFRSKEGDRYIAVEVAIGDLYEWKDAPKYPHKIGFREGRVLYECDRFGERV